MLSKALNNVAGCRGNNRMFPRSALAEANDVPPWKMKIRSITRETEVLLDSHQLTEERWKILTKQVIDLIKKNATDPRDELLSEPMFELEPH